MAQPKHISIGRLGEDIIEGYLRNRGYLIVERNYGKKWGEIDVVAKKDGVLHFVEVKTGSWEGETWQKEGDDIHRPDDHMDAKKCARMARTIQTYLAEKQITPDREWTADLAIVLIHKHTPKAQVRWLYDITLD